MMVLLPVQLLVLLLDALPVPLGPTIFVSVSSSFVMSSAAPPLWCLRSRPGWLRAGGRKVVQLGSVVAFLLSRKKFCPIKAGVV